MAAGKKESRRWVKEKKGKQQGRRKDLATKLI